VHRDIKPANIFLCRYGEDHDFVKVLAAGAAINADRDADSTGPRCAGPLMPREGSCAAAAVGP
jgi:serine/threonine protein kinase